MVRIEVIPCLSDNYAYLIVNEEKREAVLVDAPEAAPIARAIEASGASLVGVLITHHHFDHVEGLDGVSGNAKIYGAKKDASRLPKLDVEVEAGESFELAGLSFEVMAADGHTIGHIAYYLKSGNALFSADSLMHWGCGRLFEGTPEVMWETLERFAALPEETKIYSGHNYAESNGRFALSLGGYSERMEARLTKITKQNARSEPVCPASLAEELRTNPFLLAKDDDYARELGIEEMTPLERFAHIRELKDRF